MTLKFEVSGAPTPYFISKPPLGPNFLVTVQPLEQAGRLRLVCAGLVSGRPPPLSQPPGIRREFTGAIRSLGKRNLPGGESRLNFHPQTTDFGA